MAIDLTFNDEQRQLQDTAREFFQRECPPALVRQFDDSAEEFPRDMWRRMADLGWLGMCFPEEFGGLDCPLLDMYPLYLEMGRQLAPVPHLDTVALVGGLIQALGSESQKRSILPAIAGGEAIYSLALLEPEGTYSPSGIALKARSVGAGFELSGVKLLVGYAGSAERLVCVARTSEGRSADGISLFLVDPRAEGVTLERTPNTAGLPLYAVSLDKVAVSATDALGPIGGAWPALNDAMLKAAVLQSAMVVGASERVLDMSVAYAKDRVQFGQPIGRHQAVQYLVSEVAIQGYNAGLLALHAAWRIDAGLPFEREACLAKAAASKAAAKMTFSSHEVHAGIGFMVDYDLQLYTRRAKHWEFNLGDYRHHLEAAFVAGTPEEQTAALYRA